MPSSPLDGSTGEVEDHESPFRQGLEELDDLIDEGVSLSGHERNCAFLNVPLKLGDGSVSRRFVTASAALGLDFDDDARSPALVDWDHDGDLDFWISNRTAPMLRFVRNDLPTEKGWLALKLRGTRSNRDGIGSRVEVMLDDGRRLLRTLKAGEGYLAQSSKWLHFGLGSPAAKVERVRVFWAGGSVERFTGVSPGARFHLVQGTGKAAVAKVRPSAAALRSSRDEGPATWAPADSAVRALAPSRWPLPRLPYTTFSGEKTYAGGKSEGLTLVNLWATWCLPCRKELREFSQQAEALRQAGVEVVALSVDDLEFGDAQQGPVASKITPELFYQQLGAPFRAGLASAELVRRLETAYARVFGPRWALPVPTSVLLDRDGALAAFYKGAVSVERIVRDAGLSTQSLETLHDAALPFEGNWFRRPRPLDPLTLGLDLMEHGEVNDAWELAFRVPAVFQERSPEYGQFLTWIGDELMKRKRASHALHAYRAALREDQENIIVLNNIAWQLAAHSEESVRDGREAVRWAEKAAILTKHQDPAILDTLAAAYAESGDFKKAVATGTRAAQLARQLGNRPLWEGIQKGLAKYRSGRTYASPGP